MNRIKNAGFVFPFSILYILSIPVKIAAHVRESHEQ